MIDASQQAAQPVASLPGKPDKLVVIDTATEESIIDTIEKAALKTTAAQRNDACALGSRCRVASGFAARSGLSVRAF